MDAFAEQTHRFQWILCGARPRSRLMRKAGGPVLILSWLKQPPQQEIHLSAPGFCPLSQQALCSSLPPPHLSFSLQDRLHLHSSITATIKKGDCMDKFVHLQPGTYTCMYFVIVLIRASDNCSRGMEVGGEIKANLQQELFCFPGGGISCYHNQPCSCNDAWGWSDPCLTSFSSRTFYPSLPANHNPDLLGQPASKFDYVWYEFSFNVFLKRFSLICSLV